MYAVAALAELIQETVFFSMKICGQFFEVELRRLLCGRTRLSWLFAHVSSILRGLVPLAGLVTYVFPIGPKRSP